MNSAVEQFDVLIIGAGISGIGAAHHLQEQCPDKRFCVLESKESYGGTWLLHKYPGIRSDSDMFTFGYRFKPWEDTPIASGEAILQYMGEVISDANLDQHIRYNHQIVSASWCSRDKNWTIIANTNGDTVELKTRFLWMCQGYYDHENPYTPQWQGMDAFNGEIVHPQHWPETLDYSGKRIIVIGSGATAATVVPALAGEAAHVTMLQRSPTYFYPRPNNNELATQLRTLDVDPLWVHEIARRQVLKEQYDVIKFCEEFPDVAKDELVKGVKEKLSDDYDVERHFTPNYNPWRQRIAVAPEGDLFEGINSGKASVVTDEIECFTEKGLLLKSGEELEADIIVTATGFNISVMGGIEFAVDGQPVDFGETVNFRGMMFTGVPNMTWIMGYFRASWTLRVDLISDFVCRMLQHMDHIDADEVSVVLPEEDLNKPLRPWADSEVFNPGYLMRSMSLMPKRGPSDDWQLSQDYWEEREQLPKIDLGSATFKYA